MNIKILSTGSIGLIGLHMVQRLLGPKNEMIGVDKLDEMAVASHATGQALDPT